MEEKHFIINSKCDDLSLSTTSFLPTKKYKGIVVISHGMKEHKKRYYSFLKYLTNKDYITIINDHRGHGKSIKDKNDLGYFYDTKAEYIIEDIHEVITYIKKQYPNLPVILFGHSMGSMCCLKYLKKYDKEIDKLILCGLPSKNPLAHIGKFFAKIISIIKSDKYRSELLEYLTFSSFINKFPEHNTKYDWLSSNRETITEYINDPLTAFTFTINGFINLYQLNIDIYSKKKWLLQNKNIPIFFIAGEDDPTIISNNKWFQSQNFYKELGYTNIKYKLYKGLRHELLNEENNEKIYQDILSFIENR